MNDKRKPDFEQLSLFYDGVLSGEEQAKIKEYLDSAPDDPAVKLFQHMDAALELDITEEQIDLVLSNTIQEVHARINQITNRRESSWGVLFSPKLLFGGVMALLLLLCAATTIDWQKGTNPASQIATAEKEYVLPTIDELKERAQGEALLQMARMTKSAFQSGVEYAAKQTEPSKGSFEGTKQTLIASALQTAMKAEAEPDPSPETSNTQSADQSSPSETLANMGKNQLAIGLGVSVLHLVSAF